MLVDGILGGSLAIDHASEDAEGGAVASDRHPGSETDSNTEDPERAADVDDGDLDRCADANEEDLDWSPDADETLSDESKIAMVTDDDPFGTCPHYGTHGQSE